MVGAPYRELKMKTDLPIRRVVNQEELTGVISQYTGVSNLESPLLIEDLAYLSPANLQQLLKFIEDSRLRVVLLSTYDVFTPPLLSRVKVFIKQSMEKTNSNMLAPSKGRERLSNLLSEDSHVLDKVRYQGKESPLIFYNDKTVPNRPNRAKLLSLIE